MKPHTSILVGLAGGTAAGLLSRLPRAGVLHDSLLAVEPFGIAFIRLITMVVVPLVVASLFTGIASLGDVRRVGRVGGRTLAYFAATTLLAATIGLLVALLLGVGQRVDESARAALLSSAATVSPTTAVAAPTFVQTVLALIPQNPFAAAAQADLLPLIVAVALFAAAATAISEDRRQVLLAFFRGVNDVCMVVIRWVMVLAPEAVFVLIAATVARAGGSLLTSLLWYAMAVVAALVLHAVVILLLVVRAGARLGILAFLRAVGDALMLAFSTASSNVALPVSMAAASDRLRVPDGIVSFVLPLGTTMNKNGAAAYKAVTAVFLAQLYLLPLDSGRLLTLLLTSALAAFAGAGIPGSSLVTTLIVLNAIGLGPRAAAGIALVVGIDRPLDMCRTTVNTIGNLAGAAFLSRREAVRTPPETP